MSLKPSGNQFGQIVTSVSAALVMARRFGGIVDFGSFESDYTNELTRNRLIEGSETLYDAQWGGDSSLVYMGNVFGVDHMSGGVLFSKNEDAEISFELVESPKVADRIQHMNMRLAARRIQAEMARFVNGNDTRAFSKIEMPVTLVDDGFLHFGLCFDEKVKAGFFVTAEKPSDANESVSYACETMKKLADSITGMWPGVIPRFMENVTATDVLNEFSEVNDLRKANPIWGTW